MHVAKVVKSFTRAIILKKILRNCEKYIDKHTNKRKIYQIVVYF